MALKFKLVEKKNLGKDQSANPKKLYVQPVYSDKVQFSEILAEISEAGIPSNQVKGVIDRMNYLIRKHLSAGRIVQFGEFGNFRYSLGSSGCVTEKDFEISQVRTPKIIFSPGETLREAKKDANMERVIPQTTSKEPDDKPDSI